MISIKDYYDLHIHSAPAPFERIADSAEIALWCAAAGMRGLAIKSHFESTVSKVHHAREAVKQSYPDFELYAGIALNRGVGGVNPGAVEIALEQKAKIVWFPTLDSQCHAEAFGGSGTYGFQGMTFNSKRSGKAQERYFVLDENGKLTDAAKDVIQLVADYDAILASGHVSKKEIYSLVDYALKAGAGRIVVTHPEFTVPKLDIPSMVELSKAGAYMEFCAVNCFPMLDTVTLRQVREMIDAVTPDRVILSSDSGQPWSPRPPETLRVFVQGLHEKGIGEQALQQMCIKNPQILLRISEASSTGV